MAENISFPNREQSLPHFMLKEICEQPEVLQTCLSTYLPKQSIPLPSPPSSLPPHLPTLPIPVQIHILGSGTSRHAGLVAQYWLEQVARIPTRVRSASEFLSAPLPLTAETLTIAITQSGETADTLAAAKYQQASYAHLANSSPVRLLGITNQAESSLARLVDLLLPTLAGKETGVAATKTFIAQLAVLICLTLVLAHDSIGKERFRQLLDELEALPAKVAAVIAQRDAIQKVALQLVNAKDCIVLGQGVNRAIALEGALKLKETTYIHAEGYAAGEFLHGPVALLDATIPVIAIATRDRANADLSIRAYEQVCTTVRKVKSHQVPTIGIITETDPANHSQWFDQQIILPAIDEILAPFLTVIPLQLLAYYIAVERGLNVDRPRNITKTVI